MAASNYFGGNSRRENFLKFTKEQTERFFVRTSYVMASLTPLSIIFLAIVGMGNNFNAMALMNFALQYFLFLFIGSFIFAGLWTKISQDYKKFKGSRTFQNSSSENSYREDNLV